MSPDRIEDFAALVAKPGIGRQNPRKLSHVIARELRGLILRGELTPGQALPSESDLLGLFGVSRNTLREALRILESESLIQIRRGRGGGAVVQQLSTRSVARYVSLLLQVRGTTVGEIHQARLVLEPPVARLVAERAGAGLEKLRTLHAAERERFGDPRAFLAGLLEFGEAMTTMCDNRTLGVLASIFRFVISDISSGGGLASRGKPAMERLTALHGEFLAAAAAGDVEGAGEAWEAYLTETPRLVESEDSQATFDIASVWRQQAADASRVDGKDKMAALITSEVRIRIAEGKVRDGDLLPPAPELAAEFGVSRPTIRECLRILEMEGLIDLRAGSRSGAAIRVPKAEMAAQLAGIALAAAQTRMVDIIEARRLIEPSVIGMLADSLDMQTIAELTADLDRVEAGVENTRAFIESILTLEARMFAELDNPAIAAALEMIHWVSWRCRLDVTITALGVPDVAKSNRRACRSFRDVLVAIERRDALGAAESWSKSLEVAAPFFRSSLGERLIVDLLD